MKINDYDFYPVNEPVDNQEIENIMKQLLSK
jgi:hypothetical protein